MEETVEQEGKEPDVLPSASTSAEELDEHASLTPDQVSDQPPSIMEGEDGCEANPKDASGANETPAGASAEGEDSTLDRTPTAKECAQEKPALLVTGRVPVAIEPLEEDEEPPSKPPSSKPRPARVQLDPSKALDVPPRPPSRRRKKALPPHFVAVAGGLLGLAGIASVLALVIRLDGGRHFGPSASSSASSKGALPPLAAVAPKPSASPSASGSSGESDAPPPEPGPWRVSQMSGEAGIRIISGKLGTRSLIAALEEEKIPTAQVFRVLKAFDDPKLFDRPKKSHSFSVAIERSGKKIRAFEYQASPTDIWQARENDEGLLKGQKLDMKVEQRRVAKVVQVKDDLKSAVVEAGFDDDIIDQLDAALGDRISLSRFSRGSTLRIIAQEQTVFGKFSRYLSVDAVEYTTPKAERASRVYRFGAGKSAGYFDERGKAPYQGGWKLPLKLARITSHFNPKRMHPVLHTLKPHNGTDFGAPTGTPIYAVAAGTISHLGPKGPNGNLVLIEHPNGLTSGYAHMSRFAGGLKAGDKVETRQLIGYVGTTGRSTGPHLHFSMKKNGAFIDPMSILKVDGERVLPKEERADFETYRAEMDKLIDALPLPERPLPALAAIAEPEDIDTETDNHGDDDSAASATPAPSEPAPTPNSPTPAAADPSAEFPPPTGENLDSAIWKPFLRASALAFDARPQVGHEQLGHALDLQELALKRAGARVAVGRHDGLEQAARAQFFERVTREQPMRADRKEPARPRRAIGARRV